MSADDKDRASGRGEISPEEREALRRRASDLGERLGKVKARQVESGQGEDRGQSMGQAYRMVVEFAVGTAGGGFIGWLLDGWLGTTPWLMLVFLMLGFAAGMLNMIRVSRQVKSSAPLGNSVPDGDEDEKR